MGVKLVYKDESNGSEIYAIETKDKPVKICFEGRELKKDEVFESLLKLVDNVKAIND